MNPITLLTSGINDLWFWTYSIIAGWGVTFTLLIVFLVILLIRTINLQRRVDRLENRIVTNEREFNLFSKSWPGKKQ
jgi:ABC-type transport system involved in cytochrome bd biosynthesis fused ATPase/permease subunit